jgi:hypothetical protein
LIEDILSRLDKVRRTGPNNWIACCPAHEDSSPSFTIGVGDTGNVIAKCFSQCSIEEIVNAVGLGWEPWYPPKPKTDFVPSVRRPFPAADVLEALSLETMVVAVTAGDIATGAHVSEKDLARMWIAFDRIQEGRRLANGDR